MTPPADAGPRRPFWISVSVTALGAVLFVALAAWLVPWNVVPGGPLDVPSAGEVFSHAQIARVEAFSGGARVLSWIALAVSLIVALVVGFTRVGRWLTGWMRGPWPLQTAAAVALVIVIGRLATLPFEVALWRRERDAGLSTQTAGSWSWDQLLSTLITIVAASVALVVLLACVRRWPRAWPAIAGGLLAVLVVLGSFVYPLLVQPLFNDFRSLPNGALRQAVLQAAQREGVHVDDVLVADASRRTTELNAYVSGFGSSRRVVLYDNLVKDADRDETLAVVAHELGHTKHDDVLTGTALGAAGALVGVGLLGLISTSGLGRRNDRFRTATAVPALLALFAVGSLLVTPLEDAISRQIETRADIAALRTTGDRAGFVRLQRQLAVSALADPTPPAWSQWVFGTHPTALQRIAVARRILK